MLVWFRNESYTLSVRSLEKLMELGDWGEMPSDEEKGGSKERKEKKRKAGMATRRTAFHLCTTIFIRKTHCDIYIVL